MSDKRYPTRMHEVLGVEPGEIVTVMCNGEKKQMMLDDMGWMKIKKENYRHFDMAEWWEVIYIINHSDAIIRKQRLTEEQVGALKALHTLGFNWLAQELDTLVRAHQQEPVKRALGWKSGKQTITIFFPESASCINKLVNWLDPFPLNIADTLRAAGVEVEG